MGGIIQLRLSGWRGCVAPLIGTLCLVCSCGELYPIFVCPRSVTTCREFFGPSMSLDNRTAAAGPLSPVHASRSDIVGLRSRSTTGSPHPHGAQIAITLHGIIRHCIAASAAQRGVEEAAGAEAERCWLVRAGLQALEHLCGMCERECQNNLPMGRWKKQYKSKQTRRWHSHTRAHPK